MGDLSAENGDGAALALAEPAAAGQPYAFPLGEPEQRAVGAGPGQPGAAAPQLDGGAGVLGDGHRTGGGVELLGEDVESRHSPGDEPGGDVREHLLGTAEVEAGTAGDQPGVDVLGADPPVVGGPVGGAAPAVVRVHAQPRQPPAQFGDAVGEGVRGGVPAAVVQHDLRDTAPAVRQRLQIPEERCDPDTGREQHDGTAGVGRDHEGTGRRGEPDPAAGGGGVGQAGDLAARHPAHRNAVARAAGVPGRTGQGVRASRVRPPRAWAAEGDTHVLAGPVVPGRGAVGGLQTQRDDAGTFRAGARHDELLAARPVRRRQCPDVAGTRAHRNGAADRIPYAVLHEQVVVAAALVERIGAGQPEAGGVLPPPVLGDHDVLVQVGIDPRPHPYGARAGRQLHPLPVLDTAQPGQSGTDVDGRVRAAPAQGGQTTVLAVAEVAVLGAGQPQRETGVLGAVRVGVPGHGGVAVGRQPLGVQLDTAGGGGEAGDVPVLAGPRVRAVDVLQRRPHPAGTGAQLLDGQAERGELVVPSCGDVAAEEVGAHAEPPGEVEDDLRVGARLAHRLHHPRPQLYVLLGAQPDLETRPDRLVLPWAVDRQQDVGVLRGGVGEQVQVDVEVERAQRLRGAPRVGLGEHQVAAEADQGPYAVGLALQHGAAQVAAADPALRRRSDRMLVQAEGLRPLYGVELVDGGDRGEGLPGPDHVAAGRVEAAGQRVQGGEGPLGLGRVRVLADTGPGVVGDGTRRGQGVRERGQFGGADSGDAGGGLRRPGRARLPVQPEGGHAVDGPLDGVDPVRPLQREVLRTVRREPGVVRPPGPGDGVLDDITREGRVDLLRAQEAAGVAAHQQRCVGPGAHERFVVPAALQEQPGGAQGEGRVGAGPHPQPVVGVPGTRGPPRVDDGDPRAPGAGVGERGRLGEPGLGRVVPPQHREIGGGEVGGRQGTAEGEGVRPVLVPVADLGGVADVGAAEEPDEPLDPVDGVRQRRPAGRGHRERHRLSAVPSLGPAQPFGDLGERLVPADGLPLRVGVGLRGGTAQGPGQPVGAVHDLGRGPPLGTQGGSGGMRGVGPHTGERPALDGVDGPAPGAAQSAVALLLHWCYSPVVGYRLPVAGRPLRCMHSESEVKRRRSEHRWRRTCQPVP